MIQLVVPPASAREPVLDEQLVGDGQDQREGGDCYRPPHSIWCDGQQHVVSCTSCNVHVVVTNAETSDQCQPATAIHGCCSHSRSQHEQRVVLISQFGRNLRTTIRHELVGHARVLVQRVEP